MACKAARQRLAARADDAGDAQNLTGMKFEAHVREGAGMARFFTGQDDLAAGTACRASR